MLCPPQASPRSTNDAIGRCSGDPTNECGLRRNTEHGTIASSYRTQSKTSPPRRRVGADTQAADRRASNTEWKVWSISSLRHKTPTQGQTPGTNGSGGRRPTTRMPEKWQNLQQLQGEPRHDGQRAVVQVGVKTGLAPAARKKSDALPTPKLVWILTSRSVEWGTLLRKGHLLRETHGPLSVAAAVVASL